MEIMTVTDLLISKQLETHYKFQPESLVGDTSKLQLSTQSEISSPKSINSSIQNQVQDMEKKLDMVTKELKSDIGGMEKNITRKLEDAITEAMKQVQPDALQSDLKQMILDGTRAADKLSGDIKRATETVEQLQTKTDAITKCANEASEKASKEYLTAKARMDATQAEIQSSLIKATDKAQSVIDAANKISTDTSTTSYQKPFQKDYPDEYIIDEKKVVIRVKKYTEDTTPIICNSSSELLTAYELLRHVSRQYGIFMTPLNDLQKWNINTDTTPPTFPFDEDDFATKEDHDNAYRTMSLAIATKLKKGVEFGKNYVAATLTISPYVTDGYRMIFQLMQTIHPRLLRNKAARPSKPTFDGDINGYLNKYNNWMQFQLNRKKPHLYDADEIADDVIFAIKNSIWAAQLKDGLDITEQKLDKWKNNDDDPFPTELQLKFIGQTIMSYYIERNINPFDTTSTGEPSARYMSTPRGRSRYQNHDSSRAQTRSRSVSSNSNLIPCTVCGGQHKSSTVGCPHLYRHVQVQKYVQDNQPSTINQHIHDIEQDRRRRSTSRNSNQSNRNSSRSQSSTRSRRE
jgi:hypothetical protein